MTNRDRVLAALNRQPVDRVPFSFWYHFSGENAQGEQCVKAHLDYYRRSKVDYVKIMSDGFSGPATYDIKKASDWRHVRPQGKNTKYFQGQVERAARINEELKGECCTFYNVFAPFSVMRWAGDDMVMSHLREDEESTLMGLSAIAEDVATLAEGLISQGGCTGIYMALQGAEKGRFSYEEYRKLVMPSDLTVLNRANAFSETNIAHLCGWAGDPNNLSVWQDYPARAVNWAIYIEGMGLSEGRDFFGKEKVLIGGFDNRADGLLYKKGTKDEIKAFAKKVVHEYEQKNGNNQGLIIGADCTLRADVDDTRFAWVLEALEELGS